MKLNNPQRSWLAQRTLRLSVLYQHGISRRLWLCWYSIRINSLLYLLKCVWIKDNQLARDYDIRKSVQQRIIPKKLFCRQKCLSWNIKLSPVEYARVSKIKPVWQSQSERNMLEFSQNPSLTWKLANQNLHVSFTSTKRREGLLNLRYQIPHFLVLNLVLGMNAARRLTCVLNITCSYSISLRCLAQIFLTQKTVFSSDFAALIKKPCTKFLSLIRQLWTIIPILRTSLAIFVRFSNLLKSWDPLFTY